MVLGRDRRAALAAPPRDISAWTATDVARALRRARTTQGLRLDEVGQGAGVSVQDLRALEAAALDRFPDSLSALRAVRRSADYLGLPGDQLALILMERWPLRAARGTPSEEPTSTVPAIDAATVGVPAIDAAPLTGVVARDRRKRSRQALLGAAAAAATGPGTSEVVLDEPTDQVVLGGAEKGRVEDTQAVPLVTPEPPPARLRRHPGGDRRGIDGLRVKRPAAASAPDAPPAWLRVVVVAVVLAVLAGVTGIVVTNLHHGPSRTKSPAAATKKTGGKSAAAAAKVTFTTAPTSATSADITVGASSFTVTIDAVGYAAWVQVTSPTQSAPLFSGMLYTGQSHTFAVHSSVTVETGSVAGHATVSVAGRQVGTYTPSAAPFYMTFKAG